MGIKVGQIVSLWPVGLVGAAVVVSLVNGGEPSPQAAPSNVSSVVSPSEALLDYTEETGEFIRESEQRISAIEAVVAPMARQNTIEQEQLVATLSGYKDFDNAATRFHDILVLSISSDIEDELKIASKQNNRRIEWEIAAKVNSLVDQLWAVNEQWGGFVPVEDGPERDKVSDLAVESLAMSAFLSQVMAGENVAFAQADITQLRAASERLQSAIQGHAFDKIPLSAISTLPMDEEYEPSYPVSSEVENVANN